MATEKILGKWTLIDDGRRYRVTVEVDGRDCDGPITHGVEVFEMSYGELAMRVGLAAIRHGNLGFACQTEDHLDDHAIMVFSNSHDEGFSRTTIEWAEL